MRLEGLLVALQAPLQPERLLDAERALELANKAHSLYERQPCEDKGKLLKIVLSNCSTDGVTLWPVYRKPFDLIFNRVKTEEWCARRDSNSRPFGSKGKFANNTEQRRPVKPNKMFTILPTPLAHLGSLWRPFADRMRTGPQRKGARTGRRLVSRGFHFTQIDTKRLEPWIRYGSK